MACLPDAVKYTRWRRIVIVTSGQRWLVTPICTGGVFLDNIDIMQQLVT
jgi:hypothetical protein